MAERLAREAMPQLHVSSAGLDAVVGHRADETARELMSLRGLDIDAHRAQQINLDMCQRADLILVMERVQRQELERRYPFTAGKVFRICEASDVDVPDPYGAPRSAFEQALALMDRGVLQWADRISRVSSR